MSGPQPGPDGKARCPWALSAPDFLDYHDHEWGRPVHDSRAIYERIVLEGFQSGLAWITILRKRPAFRVAFAGFHPEAVAGFTDDDVARLLGDPGIVRHRGKILAAIGNARATLALEGTLADLVWSYAPAAPSGRPATVEQVPAITLESQALAQALRARGFRFIGPTTAYALMQACGVVDDHLWGCCVERGE